MGQQNQSSNRKPLSVFVPGVTLVAQDNNNACWYASTLMVFNWYKEKNSKVSDFTKINDIDNLHKGSNALPWSAMKQYANLVGMQVRPLMTPSPELLGSWLEARGPIWTDGLPVDWKGNTTGSGHVVVIAGIKQVPNSDGYEIYVYDPWPPGSGGGHEGWRPISHLVSILRAGSDPKRNVTFMQY